MIEFFIGIFVGGTIGVFPMSSGRASVEAQNYPLGPLIEELISTLRLNLGLLRDELKTRRVSGAPEYIAPVENAVERTESAIAKAEGWK